MTGCDRCLDKLIYYQSGSPWLGCKKGVIIIQWLYKEKHLFVGGKWAHFLNGTTHPKWGAGSQLEQGRAAFGEIKFQHEIPEQRAHRHSRRKLWYFYLSHRTWSVSTFPASDLMWLGPRVGFPCSWGADGARLCNVGCGDSEPMPRPAAPYDTQRREPSEINTKI